MTCPLYRSSRQRRVRWQVFGALLACLLATCLSAGEPSPTAVAERDTAQEALRPEFSLEHAAAYLDRRAHLKEQNCFACHSTFTYLPARSLIDPLADEVMRSRILLERIVTRLGDPLQAGQVEVYHRTRIEVLAAVELARHDAVTTGRLSPVTRQALAAMWKQQAADGGVRWIHVGEAPQAIDDWWPAAMIAVGVGAAPDGYADSEPARTNLEKLRGWFRAQPAATLHERELALLAHAAIGGILTDELRARYLEAIVSTQHTDGGWSMADLAPWQRKDGKPIDPERTDGYATALSVYVLARSGMPATDAPVQRGAAWIKSHQREGGGWFTQSPFRQDIIAGNTGTSFAIQALAACGEFAPPEVSSEQFLAAHAQAEKAVPVDVYTP